MNAILPVVPIDDVVAVAVSVEAAPMIRRLK